MSPTQGKTPIKKITAVEPVINKKNEERQSVFKIPGIKLNVFDSLIEIGFYSTLAGAAAFGVIDPPLAVLVGLGVLIAKHSRSKK